MFGEAAHRGEEFARLLRRQHGGRLVEDHDPGVAVERLEDLDPLAKPDRESGDARPRVQLEAEATAKFGRVPFSLGPIDAVKRLAAARRRE